MKHPIEQATILLNQPKSLDMQNALHMFLKVDEFYA